MGFEQFQIKYGELSNAQYQAGTTVGDLIRGAGSLACNVARNYTNWSQGISPLYFPFQSGFFDGLCGPGTNPPPPQLPFTGGQCPGRLYRVSYTQAGGAGGLVPGTSGVVGPVRGVIAIPTVDGQQAYGLASGSPIIGLGSAPPSYWQEFGLPTITSVVPFDGDDTCGNPQPSYPPVQPTPNNLSLTVPVFVSPTLTIPVNFVYVRPTIDINGTANIKFNPNFNIKAPDLNLNFEFGPFNITIGPSAGGGQPSIPPAPDPRPNPPKLPPSDESDSCDLTEVNRKLDELLDCDRCDPTYTFGSQSLGTGNSFSGDVSGKELLFLDVDLTTVPQNVKSQSGGGVAPDVYYAGWYAFTFSGVPGDRHPIHYQLNSFKAPEGATGAIATLYEAFRGVATLRYRTKNET